MGFILGAWIALLTAPALAHPISVVTESAYVERDKITVEVEVFAEDLYFYHGLKPDDRNEVAAADLREAESKHGALLLERLPVFDAAGHKLAGKVVSTTGDEFPDRVPMGELMGYSLVYRLEYPLEKPPAFLSFSQRLVGADDGFPALVDFRVKQAGHEEQAEATLKPGNVRTVRFAWSDGAATADHDDRETWMKDRRDDALGATALNTVRSFLYITPREVRHELLIPFPLLEGFLPIERAEPDFVTHEEQQAAKPKVGEFFSGKNPLTIDGDPQKPASASVEFFTLDDRNLAKAVPRRTVSAVNARVGVILTYPIEHPASEVTLRWDAFNRQAWKVDAFCFVGDEVLRPKFSAATRDTTFTWKRPAPPKPTPVPVARVAPAKGVSVPWLSLLLATGGVATALTLRKKRPATAAGIATGLAVLAVASWGEARLTIRPSPAGPSVSPGEADAIARTLHANLYRAADAATDEEAVEALAAAVDGELFRTLGLQLLDNMRGDDPDGAVLAVQKVKILTAKRTGEPTDSGGFDYALTWDVTARLEHWGHVHDRRYRYDAVLRIEPRDGRWAITSIDLRDAKLIEEADPDML